MNKSRKHGGPMFFSMVSLADYSMANPTIAYTLYTLGRGMAYIFDMSSTSGCLGATYFQEFDPILLDMSLECPRRGALHKTIPSQNK